MNPRDLQQIGPYPVVRYLAEGGMAWVFEVSDPRFERARRALKVMKPDVGVGGEIELFEQEAQLLASMDHPNVVHIFDFGRDETTGLFYYTMTFVDGPSLHQLVTDRDGLGWEEACELFLGVLAGLEQIHAQNVVHRDITPRNVLVAPGRRAVLMDLGIARETVDSEATQYTQVIRGTPLYMSPEQSAGRRPTKSSDVFSLGLCLYYTLKGMTVYDETDQVDTRNSHSVREYLGHLKLSNTEFTTKFARGIPRSVRDVIRKACRLDPRTRYPDAAAMRVALDEAIRAGRSGSGAGRWLAAAAAVVAVAAGTWWLASSQLSGKDELPEPEQIAAVEPVEPPAALEPAVAPVVPPTAEPTVEPEPAAPDPTEQAAERAAEEARERARAEQARHRETAGQSRLQAQALLSRAEKLQISPGNGSALFSQAQGDYRAARYAAAVDGFDEAVRALEATVPDNVPPRLLERMPPETEPLLAEGQRSIELSVVAEDLDEDALRYRWSVGGEPREESTGTLALDDLRDDAEVSVTVSDGKGGEVEASWQVAVNERPELSVTPRGTVEIAVGQTARFSARASDPDGDPLTTDFFVEGEKVASGERFEFQAVEAGSFGLVVTSTDVHGAATSSVHTIEVAPRPPSRTTAAAAEPARKAAPPPPQKTAARAPAAKPAPASAATHKALATTLQQYRKALIACNSLQLQAVWRMSSRQIDAFENICRSGGKTSVVARPRKEWGVQGSQGTLCLDYHETVVASGTRITVKKRGVYTGEFEWRDSGWRLTTLSEGCHS